MRDGERDLVLGRRIPSTRGAWPPHARIANMELARRLRDSGLRFRKRRGERPLARVENGLAAATSAPRWYCDATSMSISLGGPASAPSTVR